MVLALILSLNTAWAAPADPGLQFSISKPHGLLIFVQTLADYPHRTQALRSVFESSPYNTKEAKLKIAEFKFLDKALSRGIDFDEFPIARHAGFSIKSQATMQSAYAADLTDFETRMSGLLNMKDQATFFSVLKYFAPIYDKLVWNPGYREMIRAQQLYDSKARQWNMAYYYAKAKYFYRSSWPQDLKFKIVLYPSPQTNTLYAESIGGMESVGAIPGDRNLEGRFGVIYHEICHSLYQAQSESVQKEMDGYFRSSPSKYRQIAYNYFDEVMATALGNGWFFNKIAKKPDTNAWYNEEIINGMARATFPMVEEYMNGNKTLDKVFVDRYIALFEKTFPTAVDQTQYLLSYLYLVTDGQKIKVSQVSPVIHKVFQVKSMESSSPMYVERTVKTMKDGGDLPFFIVLDRTELIQLTEAAKREPTLFPGVENILGVNGNGVYRFDTGGVPISLAVVESPVDFDDFFGKIKKIKQLNTGQWYPIP